MFLFYFSFFFSFFFFFALMFWVRALMLYMKTELRPVNQFTKQIAAVVKHLFGKKEIPTHKIQ